MQWFLNVNTKYIADIKRLNNDYQTSMNSINFNQMLQKKH